MIGEGRGLGEKIFERRPVALFHLAGAAITGIEIIAKERPEIDLLERIFFLGCGGGCLNLRLALTGVVAVSGFFFAGDNVEHGNGWIKFLQDRVLDHLGVDHLLELKLVERQHAHHLHQPRSEYLLLRYP